jgi:hypothetical protein
MRTPKAYVATTTTHIGIKRDPAKLSSEQSNPANRQSLKEFRPRHCDSKSMFSFFDKLFHPFECPNPNCQHKFYGLSRWLIHANEVVCPKCGTRKTMELNQTAGDRGDDSDSANELNMKARRKKKLGT